MDQAKRLLVQSWLRKAQRDLVAAQKLAEELPDIAIYHCQQGAEKALKGFLILHNTDSGDTHNINSLVRAASAFKPEFMATLKEAGYLSQYNQTYRYPRETIDDFNPSPGELKKAFRIAKEVYTSVIDAMPQEVVEKKQSQPQQSQQPNSATNSQALWNKYSEGLDPQRPVERTKALIRAALQDGLSEDAITSVLEHDPHTQKVKQEQGADKAKEYIKRLFRSVTYDQQQSNQSQQTKPNRRENDQGLGI